MTDPLPVGVLRDPAGRRVPSPAGRPAHLCSARRESGLSSREEDAHDGGVNVLLLYPEFPDTFWSFKHALKFVRKRASLPPMGLLTVAAMLPADWELRLVDVNVRALRPRDIEWADMVFISAMIVQRDSARELIARCRAAGRTIVAGGPLFTAEHESFPEVDHFVLNEAEITLPPLPGGPGAGPGPAALFHRRTTPTARDPGAALGPDRPPPLRHDERPVLPRLSLRLRVLQRHRRSSATRPAPRPPVRSSPSSTPLATRLARAPSSSSTTTSSATSAT